MWLQALKLITYAYAILTLIPKSWQRIKRHAQNTIEFEKYRRKKLKEAPQIVKKCNESDTLVLRKAKSASQVPNELAIRWTSSQTNNNRTGEYDDNGGQGNDNITYAKYSVSKIAHDYERKAHKQRVHVASPLVLQKRHTMSFFEGFKVPAAKAEPPNSQHHHNGNGLADSRLDYESLHRIGHHYSPLSTSLSSLPKEEVIGDDDVVVVGQLIEIDKSNSNSSQFDVIRRRKKTHVETVEDILNQQRFSRSLSSYSISDLLKDQPAEPNIDQIINEIH